MHKPCYNTDSLVDYLPLCMRLCSHHSSILQRPNKTSAPPESRNKENIPIAPLSYSPA
ncbi:hypothetical protein BDV11DRAFT_186073, partial [Aspergillus similis]